MVSRRGFLAAALLPALAVSGRAGAEIVRPADPFDLSYDALEKFWGKLMVDRLYGPRQKEACLRLGSRKNPGASDPTGMAKSHDLLLAFHKGSGSAAAGAKLAESAVWPPGAYTKPFIDRETAE